MIITYSPRVFRYTARHPDTHTHTPRQPPMHKLMPILPCLTSIYTTHTHRFLIHLHTYSYTPINNLPSRTVHPYTLTHSSPYIQPGYIFFTVTHIQTMNPPTGSSIFTVDSTSLFTQIPPPTSPPLYHHHLRTQWAEGHTNTHKLLSDTHTHEKNETPR